MIRLTFFSLAATTALLVAAANTRAADPVPAESVRSIDVVLCLDVSGSMQGLVDSAKIKLWDMVNELAKIKPTPNLRVSLYSYGHQTYSPASGWVRKETDLTTDLDEVYRKLNALTINGGEEYVARVSRDAIQQQKWSTDKDALKLVFVCGNEPVNQDPTVKLDEVVSIAKDKGVIVNAIYCNWNHPQEVAGYRDFATAAGGKFATIEHNQRIVQIETPFDKKLVDLGAKLNTTYVAYGKERTLKAANQQAQDANAAGLGQAAAAGRAATKGGALYKNSEWCLVDKCIEDPKFDITKVPEEDLNDELKKMTPAQRVEFVNAKRAEREAIQKEIAEANAKRSTFIAEEMKKGANNSDKALDTALKAILREQAAAKGIKIPD